MISLSFLFRGLLAWLGFSLAQTVLGTAVQFSWIICSYFTLLICSLPQYLQYVRHADTIWLRPAYVNCRHLLHVHDKPPGHIFREPLRCDSFIHPYWFYIHISVINSRPDLISWFQLPALRPIKQPMKTLIEKSSPSLLFYWSKLKSNSLHRTVSDSNQPHWSKSETTKNHQDRDEAVASIVPEPNRPPHLPPPYTGRTSNFPSCESSPLTHPTQHHNEGKTTCPKRKILADNPL